MPSARINLTLGTAGHIDHGKTTLIKAVTGINTDRLKEEQARGITIELGFAFLDLPSGQHIGVVDVPGHEKFVRNMVAAASGIDIILLVVAADDGVMPQTVEAIDHSKAAGVPIIVAINKMDLADANPDRVKRELTEHDPFLDQRPDVVRDPFDGVELIHRGEDAVLLAERQHRLGHGSVVLGGALFIEADESGAQIQLDL